MPARLRMLPSETTLEPLSFIKKVMHIPVLQKEVLGYLDPEPNENFIDATFGLGGHSKEILKKIKPKGKILGIEVDPEILNYLESELREEKRLIVVNDSYTNLKQIVKKYRFRPVNGILFDLGMSSWHLEKSGRGFSFQKDEPLDMR
ncbi:MAG: 16S rRNA (cytosine(1402)-N(4))-methyltransferase, partial [Candidatus Nealsonbacteria bacterium]